MAEKSGRSIQLKGMSALYAGAKEQVQDGEKIVNMPLDRLKPHPLNPYNITLDIELLESIRESGLQEPIVVRALDDNTYQIISGHCRHAALTELGEKSAKVYIRVLSDDEAIIALVDGNNKREKITPTERARAFELRLAAVERKRGRPSMETEKDVRGGHLLEKKGVSARKEVADAMGISEGTAHRLSKIKELTPEFQQMLDAGDIGLEQASQIALLKPEEQSTVFEFMDSNEITKPTKPQASQLKLLSENGALTENKIREVFKTKIEKNCDRKVVLDNSVLSKYFPPDATPREITEYITGLLDRNMYRQRESKEKC